MKAWWLTFDGHSPGCVEAEDVEQAKSIGEKMTGAKMRECDCLPYPARPRLNEYKDPKWGVCPSFCYTPEQCKGESACPQNPCCTN